MRKKAKNWLCVTAILFIFAALFTILVTKVDVRPIGPQGSSVGFAGINGTVANLIGTHKVFYYISSALGYLSLMLAAGFAAVGVMQMVKTKSISGVDKKIVIMGFMYVLVLGMYVGFDKLALNYRPVILDEGLEPSYPSSHTMLAVSIIGCAMVFFNRLRLKQDARDMGNRFGYVIMALAVLTRLMSGVHWFTDIIGGVLISLVVVSLYYTLVLIFAPHRHHHHHHEDEY